MAKNTPAKPTAKPVAPKAKSADVLVAELRKASAEVERLTAEVDAFGESVKAEANEAYDAVIEAAAEKEKELVDEQNKAVELYDSLLAELTGSKK